MGTQAGQPDTSATDKSCAMPPDGMDGLRRKAFAFAPQKRKFRFSDRLTDW